MARPCPECPFSRAIDPERTGAPADVYIGQAHGPFFLPCHMDPKYGGPGSMCVDAVQCGGAAVYRANVGWPEEKMPDWMHRLPPDHAAVFSSPEELLAHHAGVSPGVARLALTVLTPLQLARRELAQVKAGAGWVVSKEGEVRRGGTDADRVDEPAAAGRDGG